MKDAWEKGVNKELEKLSRDFSLLTGDILKQEWGHAKDHIEMLKWRLTQMWNAFDQKLK